MKRTAYVLAVFAITACAPKVWVKDGHTAQQVVAQIKNCQRATAYTMRSYPTRRRRVTRSGVDRDGERYSVTETIRWTDYDADPVTTTYYPGFKRCMREAGYERWAADDPRLVEVIKVH